MFLFPLLAVWLTFVPLLQEPKSSASVEDPMPGVRLLGQELETSKYQLADAGLMRFTPDGKHVLGVHQNQLLLFDPQTLELERTLSLPVTRVTAIGFSEGHCLVVGQRQSPPLSPDIVQDLDAQEQQRFEDLAKRWMHQNVLLELQEDYELQSEKVIPALPLELAPEQTWLPSDRFVGVRFSPNHMFVALVGTDSTRILNRSTLEEVARTTQGDVFFFFTDDQSGFFAGTEQKIWHFLMSDNPSKKEIPKVLQGDIRLKNLDNDHSTPVIVDTEKHLQALRGQQFVDLGLATKVSNLRLSPNGRWLSCLRPLQGGESVLLIRDLGSRSSSIRSDGPVREIPLGRSWPQSLQISPDGQRALYWHQGGFSVVTLDQLAERLKQTEQAFPLATEVQFFNQDRWLKLDDYHLVDLQEERLVQLEDENIHWRTGAAASLLMVGSSRASSSGFSLFVGGTPNHPAKREFHYQLPEVVTQFLKWTGSAKIRRQWQPFAYHCRFSPDEKQLFVVFQQHQRGLRFAEIDRQAGVTTRRVDLMTDGSTPSAAQISADGSRVAVLADQSLSVFDSGSGETLLQRPVGSVTQWHLSRDGSAVAAMNQKQKVCQYLQTESQETTKFLSATCCGFAQGADRFVVAYDDGRVEIRDSHNLKILQKHQTHFGEKRLAGLSHRGDQVVFALDDTRLELWNLKRIQP